METAEIIHIITEPSRFRLLQLLLRHHYCVKALSKKMGVSESAISQHMRVLKRCGIAEGIKIGYQIHYQIDKDKILMLIDKLQSLISSRPQAHVITKDLNCTCEYISECIKRDAKILSEQGYGK